MKLLDQMDLKLRQLGSPRTTRKTYATWVEKYFRFILKVHGNSVHPRDLGAVDVERWLTQLAVADNVAPATQNVALQSVLFLYKRVLGIELTGIDALRARKTTRLPTVLSMPELGRVFEKLRGIPLLVAKLQTGCGLRLNECLSLRVKDLCFDSEHITVRGGKGRKDRVTCFPSELHSDVQRQLDSMRVLHEHDRRDGNPGVSMPHAFGRKSPSAASEWAWFYIFASGNLSRDPDSKVLARHHMNDSHINRQFKAAAQQGRVAKRVTSHTFRHSFATHMLATGTDIRQLASMMGHSDIRTTMIYTHVVANTSRVQRTPFAEILASPAMVRQTRAAIGTALRIADAG